MENIQDKQMPVNEVSSADATSTASLQEANTPAMYQSLGDLTEDAADTDDYDLSDSCLHQRPAHPSFFASDSWDF